MHPRRPLRAAWLVLCLFVTAGSAIRAATYTVAVDPSADRRAIDQRIYGVNFASNAQLAAVHYPLNRWGGNSTTRYNWRIDVGNHAMDWFFMNIVEAPDPGTLPDGSTADLFIDHTLSNGAAAILTVPTIGWTPLEKTLAGGAIDYTNSRQKRWGFSVSKYGTQMVIGPDWGEPTPDAGNGICTNPASKPGFCAAGSSGGNVVNNDPHDTSQEIGPSFVTDWMTHIVGRVGNANGGGVRFYALDNEPMLWNSTHRDVHPLPLDYDGLWAYTQAYGAAIKAKDPGAKILGPDSWGWCDYWTSALDAPGDCTNGTDRGAHGGTPLLQWYLDQACTYEEGHGVRLVDYLDVHYYPQGDCVAGLGDANGDHCYDPANDDAYSDARLKSLKELYDADWVADSWIGLYDGRPVDLVPRLRGFRDTVSARCAGIGLALTEYAWGADNGPSAALAQAEALAIFGREGLDLATRWTVPATDSATEDAFKLFLLPLGANPPIAGESVHALSSSCDPAQAPAARPCNVTSYAVHGGGKLWVLLFNHDIAGNTANVSFAGPVGATAAVYSFKPSNDAGSRILGAGSAPVTANAVNGVVLPARTATILVLSAGQGAAGLPFADGFESTLTPWLHP